MLPRSHWMSSREPACSSPPLWETGNTSIVGAALYCGGVFLGQRLWPMLREHWLEYGDIWREPDLVCSWAQTGLKVHLVCRLLSHTTQTCQLCECAGVEQPELWHEPSPPSLERPEKMSHSHLTEFHMVCRRYSQKAAKIHKNLKGVSKVSKIQLTCVLCVKH